ncbi:hypothetical protein [Symbiobacterium terraclitae]|uniref:hypothetical protein n=1 Tax=Symbiobacterium terraclitae TaxID=557451 RepID=UPI0035B5604F
MRTRLGRLLPALALAAVLLAAAGPLALGHAVDLFGHVQVDEQGTVVAKLVDVYGGLVEGQRVEVHARARGARATAAAVMEEVAPATYRGTVAPPGDGEYEVVIDLQLGGDLHRITVPAVAGAAVPERVVAMEQIEPRWPFTRVLFVAAAAVLALGTVVALRRRPAEPEAGGTGGVVEQ